MSWKEISTVVRRLQFVKLVSQRQQSLSQLCRRFGMSRRTGYKRLARFEREGPRGLRDRSSRPHRSPRRTAAQWLSRIRRLRRRYRRWGSRKLAARLREEHPRQAVPSARTVGKWLRRMKLSVGRRRRAFRGPPLERSALTRACRSNQVWTVDFKGWFRTQDGQRVEPLTVRDAFSRYILAVRLLPHQNWEPTRRVFLGLFRHHGYPSIIRTDNGGPFGSKGPAGLTRLSAWWTALGIRVEFIKPGHPEQNGAHEQMHGVLKGEVTRPPSRHPKAQQRRIDRWVKTYNRIRPHAALSNRVPAQVYRPKVAVARLARCGYRKGWATRHVRSNGEIRWRGRKRFVGEAFVGYAVGLKPKGRGKSSVYFAGLAIGELWDTDPGGIRPSTYAPKR